jgi:signal transduction histidine kinase
VVDLHRPEAPRAPRSSDGATPGRARSGSPRSRLGYERTETKPQAGPAVAAPQTGAAATTLWLDERVLAAQIEERKQVGAELHDSVGQSLVCIGLQLARLRTAVAEDAVAAPIIDEIADSVRQAHSEIRTLSYVLQPPWLDAPAGFETMVKEFVAGFARRAAFEARVELPATPLDLSRARELTLFRILQEALVNVHRHACARHVVVRLALGKRNLVLTIRDDGEGLRSPDGLLPPAGVGLASMRARLRRLGGDVVICSSAAGTTLTAKLPVEDGGRRPEAGRPN